MTDAAQMPGQEAPKPAPKKKKAPAAPSGAERRFEDFAARTEGRIDALAAALEKTANLLQNVIDASDHKPRPVPQQSPAPNPYQVPQPLPQAQPGAALAAMLPPEYRAIIDQELGTDFRAEIQPSSGGNCLLRVFSPPEWDTRRGDEKLFSPHDVRVGLVQRASDVADVQKWCKLFAANIRQTYPYFAPKRPQNPYGYPQA